MVGALSVEVGICEVSIVAGILGVEVGRGEQPQAITEPAIPVPESITNFLRVIVAMVFSFSSNAYGGAGYVSNPWISIRLWMAP